MDAYQHDDLDTGALSARLLVLILFHCLGGLEQWFWYKAAINMSIA